MGPAGRAWFLTILSICCGCSFVPLAGRSAAKAKAPAAEPPVPRPRKRLPRPAPPPSAAEPAALLDGGASFGADASFELFPPEPPPKVPAARRAESEPAPTPAAAPAAKEPEARHPAAPAAEAGPASSGSDDGFSKQIGAEDIPGFASAPAAEQRPGGAAAPKPPPLLGSPEAVMALQSAAAAPGPGEAPATNALLADALLPNEDLNVVSAHHIQIALTKDFARVLFDRTYDAYAEKIDLNADLRRAGLEDGEYFVRIAVIDLLGSAEPFSSPRSFVFTKHRAAEAKPARKAK